MISGARGDNLAGRGAQVTISIYSVFTGLRFSAKRGLDFTALDLEPEDWGCGGVSGGRGR